MDLKFAAGIYSKAKTNLNLRYDPERSISRRHLLLVIILLMTASQMAMMIYLPSLPVMANFFGNMTLVELTITIYIFSYGCSQFFYGPFSDVYGRRVTVLIGLVIFIIGSLISSITHSIWVFIFGRILQGFGMGTGDTMGRAVLCDSFSGNSFVKAAAYIGMASVITPVVAPIVGAYIQHFLHWRVNFIFLFLYGIINLCIVIKFLPETNKQPEILDEILTGTIRKYFFILRNPVFIGYFIPGLVAFFGEIAYNMTSPFLIQIKLGFSPIVYSWLTGFIIVGLFLGALAASKLSDRYGHETMVLFGASLLVASSMLMLLLGFFVGLRLITIILPMTLFMLATGITYPNTNLGALAPFTAMAGTAGALQGGLQMLFTGVLSVFAANLPIHSQIPLAILLTATSISGLVLFLLLTRKK